MLDLNTHFLKSSSDHILLYQSLDTMKSNCLILFILYFLIDCGHTYTIFKNAWSSSNNCPCANQTYCSPLTVSDRPEVVGYVVRLQYYKQFDWSKLTTVIVGEDELRQYGAEFVCFAHEKNTRVLIAAYATRDELRNATARKENSRHFFDVVKTYHLDGANIDIEFLTPREIDRRGLTDYVKETNEIQKAFNRHSLTITDVPWLPDLYQGHNTWALAENSDFLFIMAYDEQATIPPCTAGANAPLRRTTIATQLFKDIGIPGHKLVLALPWYGYRFNCIELTKDDLCVSERQGLQCKRQSIAFGGVSDSLAHSLAEPKWSNFYGSPYLNYKTSSGVQQIWYDDSRSLKLKYDIASKMKLRGVGVFSIDYLNYANSSDPMNKEMWDALPKYK